MPGIESGFRLLELRCRIAGVVREICVQIARKLCRFGVGSLGAEFFGSSVSLTLGRLTVVSMREWR